MWREFYGRKIYLFCGSARALAMWRLGGRTWFECLDQVGFQDRTVHKELDEEEAVLWVESTPLLRQE
jgi:hypothetical protein